MVARFGTVAVVKDGFSVTDGHLLIVPLRHTPDWFSMTDQESTDRWEALLLKNPLKCRTIHDYVRCGSQ